MAYFYGTADDDRITPTVVGSKVTTDPPGSFPSEADDVLYGYGGRDQLDGGGGTNLLYGGSGNDTYFVHSSGDLVIEAADEGNDAVNAYFDYILPDNLETLRLYAGTTGTGNSGRNDVRYYGPGSASLFGMGGMATIPCSVYSATIIWSAAPATITSVGAMATIPWSAARATIPMK